MASGQRKVHDVPLDRVRELAALLHTHQEIAANLGISLATLDRRLKEPEYQAAFQEGRATGCAKIRARQFELAMDGYAAMLIWLGKNYLGQRDTIETQITSADGAPLELRVIYREPAPITIDVEPERRQISAPNGHAN